MAGKKNPNLGDKLRQEREGAENTLRDSRSKTADSSTGDGGKKKAEHRRQIRHEADLAKMRSKKLKSENTEGRFVTRPILLRCAVRS